MIVNYTGNNIIINTSDDVIDHSDINNFTPNSKSIILGDGDKAEFIPKKHIYIITENCKHSGHFPMALHRSLPHDPIIYVGIKRDETVWFSKENLLLSDVDFGLVKTLDQSSPLLMIFNPWYVIVFYIIIIMIIISIILTIYILIKKQ
jgi:hypothetical protein